MKLTDVQRIALAERLDFVQIEIGDLQEYSELKWETYLTDRKTRRNIERIIENIGNAVIDMAKIILSASSQPVPATYREVLMAAGIANMLDEIDLGKLAALATLRNSLAHRYLDYKWLGIQSFLTDGVNAVVKWTKALDAAIQQTPE